MTRAPSPYEVLGVGQTATPAQIRTAYQQALRARVHSRPQITQAFNELRSPQRRLAADLREPARSGADELRAILDASPARPTARPDGPPPWSSLVVAGVDEGAEREIEAPPTDFRPVGVRGPSSAVLCEIDFPV